jgi:hypothetical protein
MEIPIIILMGSESAVRHKIWVEIQFSVNISVPLGTQSNGITRSHT